MNIRMKPLLTLIASLALMTWGCGEDPYLLDNNTGTWKMSELRTITYADGLQVSDVTQSDSLPTWELERIGRGIATDYTATADTFVWEMYEDAEKMIIYYRVGPWMNANLLENKLDEKVLYWVNEFAEGTVMMRTEKTARIVRP